MMPGMIMLWHGSVESIPSGWHICDGTMGTPDLKNKFVFGGGGASPPGTIGGTVTHVHDFTGDGHTHFLPYGTDVDTVDPAGDADPTTSSTPATGTTDFETHLPPYYVLAYIMKL